MLKLTAEPTGQKLIQKQTVKKYTSWKTRRGAAADPIIANELVKTSPASL